MVVVLVCWKYHGVCACFSSGAQVYRINYSSYVGVLAILVVVCEIGPTMIEKKSVSALAKTEIDHGNPREPANPVTSLHSNHGATSHIPP
jgi:hypothetical protein